MLGSYTFDKYKSKKDTGETGSSNRNEEVNTGVTGAVGENEENILVTVFTAIENADAILNEATSICRAICHARDLANEPGNVITPDVLAAEALQTAKKYELEAEVLTVKEMQERCMGAILAGGQFLR